MGQVPSDSFSLSLPPSLASNSFTKQKEPFRAVGLEEPESSSGAKGEPAPWRKERGSHLALNTGLFTAPAVLAVTRKAGKGERAGLSLAATLISVLLGSLYWQNTIRSAVGVFVSSPC